MQDANQAQFEIAVATIDILLQVYQFSGHEQLGALYQFDVTFVCEDPELKLEEWLQLPVCLTLHHNNQNKIEYTPRYVHGIIESIEQLNTSFRYSTYRLSLVPIFSLLTYRTNFQVFQHKTVPDIISEIYQQAGILTNHFDIELFNAHEPREYCVQYGESDLDFVQRLMSEEGFISYFEHTDIGSKLIISDGPEIHTELASLCVVANNGMTKDSNTITSLIKKQKVSMGKVSVKDYNFETPTRSPVGKIQNDDQGECASELALEHYQYPSNQLSSEKATKYASLRLKQQRTSNVELLGESDCAQLTAGYFQPIQEHPNPEWNDTWLLTRVTHSGRQPQVLEELADGGSEYHASFSCTPWMIPFKTVQKPKPLIHNVDTAIVTGPENEEIYCDEHGRVKVQFHWDRNGQGNEKTSCWLRTSQGWAGNQYGQFILPRIGHEVIVSFIHGDPDKPIITGSLYNGDNKPPYTLPEHKTRSTFKTSSSLGGENFNELRFEDKKDAEQVYIHAAKDMDSQIQNNQTVEVFNDEHKIVHNNQFNEIKNNRNTTVSGSQFETIKGDSHHQVNGSVHSKVGKKRLEEIGSELHLKSGQKIVLEAGTEITIKAGGSVVKIDPAGVHLIGSAINLNSGGSAGSGSGYAGKTAVLPMGKEVEQAGEVSNAVNATSYDGEVLEVANYQQQVTTGSAIVEECHCDGEGICSVHSN